MAVIDATPEWVSTPCRRPDGTDCPHAAALHAENTGLRLALAAVKAAGWNRPTKEAAK